MIFARVCDECKEYITFTGYESYEACNMKIHAFELDHENHPLMTINLDDFENLEGYQEVDYFYNKINRNVFPVNC